MPRTCWATSRGGCSRKISGEHVLTEGLFTDSMVWVKGISRPLPPRISRANLKAKVLCATHNNELGVLDDEAIKLFNSLREHVECLTPAQFQVRVDGWKIERWCMKTGHNLLASRWLGERPFTPDPTMVSIIFGEGRVPAYAVLYVVREPSIVLGGQTDRVGFIKISDSENEAVVRAFYFQLLALGLLVTALREDPTPAMRLVSHADTALDWSKTELTHRPNAMDVIVARNEWVEGETSRLTIEFEW